MYRFNNLTIRQKQTLIVLVTCGLLVMLMAIYFMADKFYSSRRSILANTTTLAEVFGMNSTAALTFDDQATAEEILSAMSAEDNVSAACIFRPDGQLFASYSATLKGIETCKPEVTKLVDKMENGYDLNTQIHTFSDKQLFLAKPIFLNKKHIGFIVISANLDELYNQLMLSGILLMAFMAALVLTAQFITERLYRTISDPLLSLISTMNQVTTYKNYNLRARKESNDELGIIIDGFNDMLTQIQQRDLQLEQHRQQLEGQVNRRTRELSNSHERLKQEMEERKRMQDQLARAQRMEAVGTLAAGVAHDLNNILSGIVSYPDLLLVRLPADSEMQKPLATIQKSGKKAAAIVQDLLTLSRRGVSSSEVVNLQDILSDYMNSLEFEKLMSDHPNVRVIKNADPDLMNIAGSPVHLSKSIMNIIANAAESINGHGTVTITLCNQYIDTPVRGYDEVQQGDYVLFKVCDTGHGIAAHDLQRIFEPFYTKKKMGRSGTGLGMAVVWGTVKDHRGYIDVESHEGKGTTFYLYFPVTRRKHTSRESVYLKDYLGDGESILVVDDIKEQREIASDLLESLGYTVTTLADGDAAVEYIQNHHVDLLLLDMIMEPGIDGLETYKRIQALGIKQKAIIASGYSESKRVMKAQELGAGAYLRKPYTIENLAQTVYFELHKEQDLAN